MSDLISIVALPAAWVGGDSAQIVRTVLDALLGMLDLDFVYARQTETADEASFDMLRFADSRHRTAAAVVARMLDQWLDADWQPSTWSVRNPLGEGDMSIVALRLGLQEDNGVIVAGSRREDFPRETERLLLGIAANEMMIGLQGAQLLAKQRRLADELDRRVALRTRELAAANEDLLLRVAMLQQAPVAVWTLRPDGCTDFMNRIWLEYTGQTLDYVQSNPEAWMTALHPDDRDRVSRIFQDGIRSGQGFTMEARFCRASDGAYRWHLNRAVALRDPDGSLVRFVGSSTDIDDLKQSQDSLRQAEARTGQIIDTALSAVVTMDARGRITRWNRQAETVFGWRGAEAIGQNLANLIIPAQHRLAHERGMRRFEATGDGPFMRRRIETTAVHRTGVEFPIELQIVPMLLDHEWIYSAFIRDITDSKLAADKLRESEQNLRQMTETIPEMLWSATPDGAIDYCNARMLAYTGFSANDIMGDGWTKSIHPDDVDQTVVS